MQKAQVFSCASNLLNLELERFVALFHTRTHTHTYWPSNGAVRRRGGNKDSQPQPTRGTRGKTREEHLDTGVGFSSLRVLDLESGARIMPFTLRSLMLLYNNSCYHHDQVNIQKKGCNISTFAFKILIFSSALLCFSSTAVLRDFVQLLHIFMLMLESELPCWLTVLKPSTM